MRFLRFHFRSNLNVFLRVFPWLFVWLGRLHSKIYQILKYFYQQCFFTPVYYNFISNIRKAPSKLSLTLNSIRKTCTKIIFIFNTSLPLMYFLTNDVLISIDSNEFQMTSLNLTHVYIYIRCPSNNLFNSKYCFIK